MKYNENKSRAGLIIALVAVLAALWLAIAYGAYTESKREKYVVSVRPGNVSYGTHSTAVIPMVSPTRRSSVPMISGSTVRSYAYYGHSTMPGATSSSGYKIHTLSSATVHSIGSGGGGGGGIGGASGSSSSSRGIAYGGVSYSMPTLALVTPTYASETSTPARMAVGPRRMPGITGDEEEGDEAEDAEGKWRWDGEGWVLLEPAIGTTKIEGGITYRWDGNDWVPVGDQGDPGLPLGDAPWLWMMLMLAAYAAYKIMRKKQNAI